MTSVLDRFNQRYMPEPNTGCWLWTGKVTAGGYRAGYGVISLGGRHARPAHRVSYELFKGPIPKGLTIDHRCAVRCCVNPDHLDAVSQRENNRRRHGRHAEGWVCKRGHQVKPHPSKPLLHICPQCGRSTSRKWRTVRHDGPRLGSVRQRLQIGPATIDELIVWAATTRGSVNVTLHRYRVLGRVAALPHTPGEKATYIWTGDASCS